MAMYPSGPLRHPPCQSRDMNPCRFSCLGYTHTLQYFPSGLSCEPPSHHRSSVRYDSVSVSPPSPTYEHYVKSDSNSSTKRSNSEQSPPINLRKSTTSAKSNQHRRCWNTANFQWMSIKRERKSQTSGKLRVSMIY